MTEQLSFAGFDVKSASTDRLFFAIFPDGSAAERIGRLAQRLRGEHRLQGRPLEMDRFHITLHHLGDYTRLPQNIVAAASKAAEAVVAPPCDLAFDRVESFRGRPGKRPLVPRGGDGVAALALFLRALGAAMMKAELGRWAEMHFTPHVTLLYDDHRVDAQTVEPVDRTTREFVLVHSLLGRTQHVPLGRWPLRG
jgi:2'-5' RNA ligase